MGHRLMTAPSIESRLSVGSGPLSVARKEWRKGTEEGRQSTEDSRQTFRNSQVDIRNFTLCPMLHALSPEPLTPCALPL